MRHIYSFYHYLCFLALLLYIPLSYGAAANQHYKNLGYTKDAYEKLNEANKAHVQRRIATFIGGIQIYEPPNSYYIQPILGVQIPRIVSKDAFAKLKKAMHMSPQIYVLLTSGYLRKHFVDNKTNHFHSRLTSLVSGFLQHEYYYKYMTNSILFQAGFNYSWGFITDWLEEERKLSHLYTDSTYLTFQVGNFKRYCWDIYNYNHNYSKTDLLVWLTKQHGWPVPTKQKIEAGEISFVVPVDTLQQELVPLKMSIIASALTLPS